MEQTSLRELTKRSTGPHPGQCLLLDFFYVVPLFAFPMLVIFLVNQSRNGHIAAANGPSRAAITAQTHPSGTSPGPSGTALSIHVQVVLRRNALEARIHQTHQVQAAELSSGTDFKVYLLSGDA